MLGAGIFRSLFLSIAETDLVLFISALSGKIMQRPSRDGESARTDQVDKLGWGQWPACRASFILPCMYRVFIDE